MTFNQYREWQAAQKQRSETFSVLFSSVSRPQIRRVLFEDALAYINRVAGGEPRKIRRAMARARSKRKAIV